MSERERQLEAALRGVKQWRRSDHLSITPEKSDEIWAAVDDALATPASLPTTKRCRHCGGRAGEEGLDMAVCTMGGAPHAWRDGEATRLADAEAQNERYKKSIALTDANTKTMMEELHRLRGIVGDLTKCDPHADAGAGFLSREDVSADYRTCDWRCALCGGADGDQEIHEIHHHQKDCPYRRAIEYVNSSNHKETK